ncbi:MAG: DUF4062 domain-containing protein [Lewinellaceae bacterium]|nr:DUF4062 domain-containing protein [Lewinellaceae bacterium]
MYLVLYRETPVSRQGRRETGVSRYNSAAKYRAFIYRAGRDHPENARGDVYLAPVIRHGKPMDSKRTGAKKVMISSTVRDLPDHRKHVMEACQRQTLFPVMMENRPAHDAEAISRFAENGGRSRNLYRRVRFSLWLCAERRQPSRNCRRTIKKNREPEKNENKFYSCLISEPSIGLKWRVIVVLLTTPYFSSITTFFSLIDQGVKKE